MIYFRYIILFFIVFNSAHADTIYNLIKIPNLEIYNIKTPNKLRYLYAKQPFTIGVDNNINCYDTEKKTLDKKYKVIQKNLSRYNQVFLKKILTKNICFQISYGIIFRIMLKNIEEKAMVLDMDW